MIARLFLIGVCASLLPLTATSQIQPQTCKDLADTVGAGYSTYLNTNRRAALNYYAKCESKSNASKAGVNLAYDGFGLGLDYSDDTKSAQCTQAKNSFSIDESEYAQVKQVFKAGLDVVSQCLTLASRGWDIKTTGYKDAVSVNIANTAANGGTLKGVDIIGGGGPTAMTCKSLPTKFPVKIGSSGLSTLCTRIPTQQLVDGTTYSQADDAFVNLQLSDGPIAIPLPGYKTSALQTVNGNIDTLQKQVAELQAKMAALGGGLKTGGSESYNPGKAFLNSDAAFCPAGSYMVSILSRSDSGGPHGITSQVQPICRSVTP